MLPVGLEHTVSANERSQTCALDRAATGTGDWLDINMKLKICVFLFNTFSVRVFKFQKRGKENSRKKMVNL
jgi:hypothetical protein